MGVFQNCAMRTFSYFVQRFRASRGLEDEQSQHWINDESELIFPQGKSFEGEDKNHKDMIKSKHFQVLECKVATDHTPSNDKT